MTGRSERVRTLATEYAVAHGAKKYCEWLLRSPGGSIDAVSRVSTGGELCHRIADYEDGAVRPAIWLDISTADIGN